jgi:hypothetical protein
MRKLTAALLIVFLQLTYPFVTGVDKALVPTDIRSFRRRAQDFAGCYNATFKFNWIVPGPCDCQYKCADSWFNRRPDPSHGGGRFLTRFKNKCLLQTVKYEDAKISSSSQVEKVPGAPIAIGSCYCEAILKVANILTPNPEKKAQTARPASGNKWGSMTSPLDCASDTFAKWLGEVLKVKSEAVPTANDLECKLFQSFESQYLKDSEPNAGAPDSNTGGSADKRPVSQISSEGRSADGVRHVQVGQRASKCQRVAKGPSSATVRDVPSSQNFGDWCHVQPSAQADETAQTCAIPSRTRTEDVVTKHWPGLLNFDEDGRDYSKYGDDSIFRMENDD